ncbi:LuxR C-terminal-related transcriptional regulator [Prauserella flavalba]|uniref:HTH luxR-type domain-containing protein n=1 Tax=Prauserella flavalba TaxID=1477506 RepID=A0A318LQ82_9PSEU|nr:LuxR C-terminal-related transcriptional regulator [Prauserella flavalba]PXY36666.1 hypothetical protein BA062_14985 [Prauserella flavalba]
MRGARSELTSFVGREPELAELSALLRARRLVTLTGVGGCGKTRLAARLVAGLRDTWPEPAVDVDLGPVSDPHLVCATVAAAAGVNLEPGGAELAALVAALSRRRLVLWLDTCEHLLEPTAELVSAVLAECPEITVLATTREPLGIGGETVWRVPPLRPAESVRLFAERASLVLPDFDGERNAEGVAAVCARLDHLPLAVELAAPWVRALSLAQIAEGLDHAFELLVEGPRDTAPRHRTLMASMAWSHDLLTEPEQRLFRRLGVFSGPFTVEAAAAVAGEGEATAPLRGVTRLLDASLLLTVEVEGELRYRMLDTVRQFAVDLLEAAGEAEAVRDRHLDFHLALAERAEPGMAEDQDRWRAVLAVHRADLGTALDRGLGRPDPDRGRRLAAAMTQAWLVGGEIGPGLRAIGRALAARPGERTALTARLEAGRALLAMAAGRLPEVADAAERGAALAREADHPGARARCLAALAFSRFFVDFAGCAATAAAARAEALAAGDAFAADWAGVLEAYSLVTRGRNDEADALARRIAERARRRRDRLCGGFAAGVAIYTELTRGRVAGAVESGRRALELAAPLGDYFATGTLSGNTAHALAVSGDLAGALRLLEPVVDALARAKEADAVGFVVPLGLTHLWLGELDEALGWFERGVDRLRHRERDWTAARCLPGLVGVLRRLGRTSEAEEWAVRGHRILTGFGAPFELADLLDEHAQLASADLARARELRLQALVVRRDNGVPLGNATTVDGLSELALAGGDPGEAVRLCAIADALRSAMGHPRPPVDARTHAALVARLRTDLDAATFERLWAEGQRADPDVVVPALVRGRGPRTGATGVLGLLTPTELEVSRLVGHGLSNPEIAERLFMSRSTVKAHLAHVYAKLGVPNRTALTALLRDQTGSS